MELQELKKDIINQVIADNDENIIKLFCVFRLLIGIISSIETVNVGAYDDLGTNPY